LEAFALVDQKLINKKEQIPTPSHPKNNTTNDEDCISITIKHVNSDKNPINLDKRGSVDI